MSKLVAALRKFFSFSWLKAPLAVAHAQAKADVDKAMADLKSAVELLLSAVENKIAAPVSPPPPPPPAPLPDGNK